MAIDLLNRAYVSEARPQPMPDTSSQEMRCDRYGNQYSVNLYNGMHALAAEGSMWIATTPTPGTGITGTAATGTSYTATQALLVLYNSENQPTGMSGRRVILDFITLICTAAGTASTSCHLAHQVDNGNRYSSGGSALTPVNPNMDIGSAGAVGKLYAGVVTATASTSAVRFIHRNIAKIAAAPAWLVGDSLTIKFGTQENGGASSVSATVAANMTIYAPPIILGPNQSYVLNEWSPARSAAQSFEFIVGWIER